MNKKANRLNAIKKIISSKRIGSQDELLKILTGKGFEVTQATLSRDLKQLEVTKASDTDGKCVYVLPGSQEGSGLTQANGFVSLDFSGNIAVIRTKPGYASGMAYDLDRHEFAEILGTIAGDDTIMLILREETSRDEVRRSLARVIPNIDADDIETE